MGTRQALHELLTSEPAVFAEMAVDFLPDESVPSYDAFDLSTAAIRTDDLLARERRLMWKVWVLDEAAFGITLSGAAYEDNPIIYANERFRALTGYALSELVGENPRLLQGPATESYAVAQLHEALRRWEPVTVDLWNYRADGERFRNRVSLCPIPDEAGTVTHWFGIQRRIDAD